MCVSEIQSFTCSLAPIFYTYGHREIRVSSSSLEAKVGLHRGQAATSRNTSTIPVNLTCRPSYWAKGNGFHALRRRCTTLPPSVDSYKQAQPVWGSLYPPLAREAQSSTWQSRLRDIQDHPRPSETRGKKIMPWTAVL